MSVFYQQIRQHLSKLNQRPIKWPSKKCPQNYVNYVMRAKFNLEHMSNVFQMCICVNKSTDLH